MSILQTGLFGERIPVTISGVMLRQLFHSCSLDYVKSVCHGRCCERKGGIKVFVHPSECEQIIGLGVAVVDNFIVTNDNGSCPLKTDDGLCSAHNNKPFGCKSSPFAMNSTGLIIVRNRYRRLRCYKCDGAVPAYEAHRWSLGQIFGESEANTIADLAASGADRIGTTMSSKHYVMMVDNHLTYLHAFDNKE